MLAVVVTIIAVPGKAESLIDALNHNAAGSRQEPGCLKWEWSRHREDPERFAIYEVYRDAEAFASHKASRHFEEWLTMIDGCIAEKVAGQYDLLGEDRREGNG
ncbi:MAG: putative quinol monooxygenase [Verrucomicrobiota bacterium]